MIECVVTSIVLDSSLTLESQRNQEAYMMPDKKILKSPECIKITCESFIFYFNGVCLLLGAKFIPDAFQRDNQIIHSPLSLSSCGIELIK